MRITVVALGTRGDVQPMIALSKGLVEDGHEVTMIAGSNFRDWIVSHRLQFKPSVDIKALMNSEKGLTWTESSDNPMKQVAMMRDLINEHGEEMYAPLLASTDSTDLFISGFVSESLVQSISEHTHIPYINAVLQPQLPTRSGPSSINPIFPRHSSILNLWMGNLSERILWSISAGVTNRLRNECLMLPAHTANSYGRARHAAPTLIGFSHHVVPVPNDWPANIFMTGYWFLDEDLPVQPSPELYAFLQTGAPPVYIGFGSMSNREPQKTLTLILDTVRKTGVRAVVSAGWGGLSTEGLSENVLVIDSVPHYWLFPQVAAVIHHGGAGTTAAGFRAGIPTMIIPHMSDQPYWGRRVHELGVGVKPVPRHKLTAEALTNSLQQLVHDPHIQRNARVLGEKIRSERGVERAVNAIKQFMADRQKS